MGTNVAAAHSHYPIAPAAAGDPVEIAALAEMTVGPPAAGHTDVQLDAVEALEELEALEQTAAVPQGATEPGPDGAGDPPAAATGGDVDDETAGSDEVVGEPPRWLTPIPDSLPVGQATGTPLLVGGEDLHDSTATLVAYHGPDGQPREMLLATVTEDAEAKLLDALALSGTKTVPVHVQEEIAGRLPRDDQLQLAELIAKAAKSVNHRLKTGDDIPEHVLGYVAAADTAVAAVENDAAASAEEKAMAAHYRAQLQTIGDRVSGAVSAAYADGGKIPTTQAYLHTGMATITKHVPAPAEDGDPELLPTTIRNATRIAPTTDPATGVASWDGKARRKATGKEYVVDLADGYTAVYRPHQAAAAHASEYSLRGHLEITAPPGGGNAHELVRRLGELHLVNRPMSPEEGEWTYLRANVRAQSLEHNQAVATSMKHAAALEELQLQEIFHARAHEAIGLDHQGLRQLAKEFQLEAAATVLPAKVKLLRETVATATGHADAAALQAAPSYQPVPTRSAGWLTWSRFDVAADPAVAKAWTGKALVHRIHGNNIAAMLATGALASTERRARMGIASGLGSSESADKTSGGANSVFLRVGKAGATHHGPALVWDNPTTLLQRSDYWGTNYDGYGAVNPESGHFKTSGRTRDPKTIAAFSNGSNEVMFRDGIDLLGAEAPSRIVCSTDTDRQAILAQLAARGISHLAGKPVDHVVTAG